MASSQWPCPQPSFSCTVFLALVIVAGAVVVGYDPLVMLRIIDHQPGFLTA